MRKSFVKKISVVILLMLLVVLFTYASGYRFTPEAAAKAHSILEKNSTLVKKVNTPFGQVFIYKEKNSYRTILPEKKRFFWRASNSFSTEEINDKNDSIRTIGYCSVINGEESGTIMAVQVKDDKIAYIEAGTELNRERKKVKTGEYILFTWDKAFYPWQVNPIALSENGEKLYQYEYPKSSNYVDLKELRWHKVQ